MDRPNLAPLRRGFFCPRRWQAIASRPRCCGGLLITFAEKSQPLCRTRAGQAPTLPRSARLASRRSLCAWPALRSEAPTLLRRGSASPNYITSVMSRRPPAATKPMPTSSPSVIAIAMPPTKANPPTTAIVDRLNLEVPKKARAAQLSRRVRSEDTGRPRVRGVNSLNALVFSSPLETAIRPHSR